MTDHELNCGSACKTSDTPADHYREMCRQLAESRDALKHQYRATMGACWVMLSLTLRLTGLHSFAWWAILLPLWLPLAIVTADAFARGFWGGYQRARRKGL